MKRLFFVLCFLSSVLCSLATEPTDLGQGLSYLRVHSLADSVGTLRSLLPTNRAFVLDLRHARANPESLAGLKAALAAHPRETPLLVLISAATPDTVVDVINQAPGVSVSLGVTRAARIEVKADPETDRRAYDALEAGTPLDELISGKLEKERFDEATLVEEFKNGNHDAEPPPLPDPTAPKNGNAPAPTPATAVPAESGQPRRLTDRVLQRAVQLHRALLALRPQG